MVDQPRIEWSDAFTLVGVKREISSKDGANLRLIPAMWEDFHHDGTLAKLEIMKSPGSALYGICTNFQPEQQKFEYYITVLRNQAEYDASWEQLVLEPCTYAKFQARGPLPQAIQHVWSNIYEQWVPHQQLWRHAGLPELELYPPGDTDDANYECEVWIPVIKHNARSFEPDEKRGV